MTRKQLEALLPRLESDDAFVRLEAERRLRREIHRDFGFRWDGPEDERSRALDRLRAWAEALRRRRRGGAPVPPGLAALDLGKLKGLPPAEVEKHLQALLAGGKGGPGFVLARPRCEECRRRPATVEVVELRRPRRPAVSRLCDPCARERGEVL